jgi:hypothetical protein
LYLAALRQSAKSADGVKVSAVGVEHRGTVEIVGRLSAGMRRCVRPEAVGASHLSCGTLARAKGITTWGFTACDEVRMPLVEAGCQTLARGLLGPCPLLAIADIRAVEREAGPDPKPKSRPNLVGERRGLPPHARSSGLIHGRQEFI